MRVACEPLPMRPITKLTPEHSGRATKSACLIRLSLARPPFNLAALVGRSQREERETGTSGTSRKVTSLRHVIHLICFHLCRLATIPSYCYMHLLLLLHQLPHAPAHHHNLSPKRSNPAGRPAAMYKVPPNRTLTPYLDVDRRLHYSQRRGRQAVRVAPCMLCRKNNTPLGLQSYQLPNPTAFFQAAAATRPYSTLSPSVKTRRQTIDFRNN
jgi:hypothetical protein